MPLPSDFLSTPYTPLVPQQEPLNESKLPSDFLSSNATDMARQNLHLTRDIPPQDVAPAKQVAQQLDLDPETVLRNKQDAFAQARDMAVDYALQDAPGTAGWFGQDRLNAAQGRGEASVLAQLEKGLVESGARLGQTYDVGNLFVELSGLRYAQNMGDDSPETAAKIQGLKDQIKAISPNDPSNLWERAVGATGQQTPIQLAIAQTAAKRALEMGTAGAAMGTFVTPGLGTGAGAIAGAGAGMTAGTIEASFMLETGSSYDEFLEQGMDPATAKWASRVYGAVASAIETVSLGPLKNLVGLGGATAPVKTTVKGVVLDFLKNASLAQLAEAGEEMAQTAVQDIVQQVFGGPDITVGETFRKATEAAIDTLLVPFAPAMGAPQLGVDLYDAKRLSNQAKEYTRLLDVFRMQDESAAVDADMQRVDAWRQLALSTELRQTDPAAFEALVQAQIDAHEDAVREVHVSGQALFQAMQAAPEEAQQILGATGLTQEEIITAADTGADVTIGLPQYLAHVAGTTIDAAVAQDMRIRPDGMTVNERDEWMKSGEEELTRLVSEAEEARVRNASWDEESTRIEDAVKNELMFANDPASNTVATQNAKVYSAFLTTLASRGWLNAYGNSPWQAFQAIWPTTQRGQAADQMQGDVQPQMLQQDAAYAGVENQAEIEEAGRLWAEMGVESPYFKRWSGGAPVVENADARSNEVDSNQFAEDKFIVDKFTKDIASEKSYWEHDFPREKAWLEKNIKDLRNPTAEEIEFAMDSGILPPGPSGFEGLMEISDQRVREMEQKVAEAQIRIDAASAKQEKFQTGKPVVARVFHTTPMGELIGGAFDSGRLGENTKAGSATLGHFFSGSERTAEAYGSDDAINQRGFISLSPDQKAELVQALDEEVRNLSEEVEDFQPVTADEFAAQNPSYVRDLVGELFDVDYDTTPTETKTYEVFVSFKNPYVYDFKGERYREQSYFDIMNQAKAAGHDGVILLNTYDGGPKDNIFAIFKGNEAQIKSVNNRGTFDPADPKILNQAAYHGSPYKFSKFSLDHIGSGEGAQAYGWGLYFAGKKEVAEWYRSELSKRAFGVGLLAPGGDVRLLTRLREAKARYSEQLEKGKTGRWVYEDENGRRRSFASKEEANAVNDGFGVVYEERTVADDDLEAYKLEQEISGILSSPIGQLDAFFTRFGNRPEDVEYAGKRYGFDTKDILADKKGQLYKVEIPEDDVMLLWDRPLSEQPEKVRAALAGVEGQSYRRWLESLDMLPFETLMDTANAIDRNNTLEDEWDDDTSEQEKIEDIKDFFNQMHENDPESFEEYVGGFGFSNIQTGQGIYQQLTTAKRGDKAASEYLNSLGIKGIKYLDGTSRNQGEGSYNYVIFDDQTIQVLETFYQQQERPNAMVQLTKGPSGTPLVTLFETANESSFLHESGHIFLNFLKGIAERADAPEDLKQMWADVAKEIGHEGGTLSIESHEQWARALEAYFREGKSPSNKLIAVFQTFSAWLRRVYDDFWARGNKPSPELKSLFDRLFATDAEIQETQARHEAAKPFFTEAELQASEDALRYERLRARAAAAQHDTALTRLTKAYFRALGGQKQFKLDAQSEADALPVYQAIAAAVKGGGMGIDDIEALIGTEAKNRLVKRLQVGAARKEGGVDLDVLAKAHGFKSTEAMLMEMTDSEKKTTYVARRAKEMMDEKAASLARGEAAREANLPEEDYHSEDRLAVLVAEAEMLKARMAGQGRAAAAQTKRIELQAVREVARRVLAGKPVSKAVAYQTFSRAELAAGKAARKAMAAGKIQEAEQHKRREMLNHALVLESIAARDRVAKQEKKIREAIKSKAATEEVLTLVRDIAARFGFQPRPAGMTLSEFVALHNSYLADQQKTVDFAAWQTARENEGYGVALPALVTDRANVKDYRAMTLEQFDDVAGAVEHIMHIDRRERQVLRNGKLVDLKAVVAELIDQIEKTFSEKSEKRFESNKALAKLKSAIFRGDASLMKMELLFRAIDGGELGPWFEMLMAKVNQAAEREDDMSAKAAQDVLDLMHNHYSAAERNAMFGKRTLIKEIGQSLTKAQLLRVLMDFGNEGNYVRRRDGEGWIDAQMSALKKYADKRDWEFVQAVWDYIDTYRAEAFATHKALTGRTPERIVPAEVETPYGTYKGGYFPVVIDPKYSQTHAGRKELENALYETPNFSFVMTKHGHLKERMKSAGGQALSFELSDLTNHLYGVIHDITHREVVMDIAKIFRDKEFMAAVERHLGKEYAAVLVPWVKDVANVQAQPQTWLEKFFRAIRMGTTVSRLAKIGVGLQQAVGIIQTMGQLGAKESWRPVAKVSKYLLTGGYALTKDLAFANESSAFMRHRITSTTREATEAFRGLSVKDRYLKKPGELMLKFLGACQKFCTDVPSWAAAYDVGLKKYGDHDKAVTYADHIVRVSQGSGQVKDLTEIQRNKSEAVKLMTMFYSFLASAYAQLTDPLRGAKPHFGQFMWITTTLVILGPTLAELVSGRPPEEDEDWEKWAAMNSLKFGLSLVPGVKDIAGAALTGFGYKFSPVEAPLQSLVWLMRNAPEAIAEEEYDRLFKPALDVVGVWAVLPSDQLYITSRGAYGLLQGDPSYDFVDLIYKRKKEE